MDATDRIHEIRDLLFFCVNLARHLGVDAEQALCAANYRFEHRFAHVEAGLNRAGLQLGPAVRDEMKTLWEEALIMIPPTLFSPGVAAPLQNMVLRA